mmetsp:Transcript_7640/g.12196  ORF Transcript_7640/g.12196 Transcript_7640/m.12196 type:complete len:201 (+) Transcript_7640:3159-3761(+)
MAITWVIMGTVQSSDMVPPRGYWMPSREYQTPPMPRLPITRTSPRSHIFSDSSCHPLTPSLRSTTIAWSILRGTPVHRSSTNSLTSVSKQRKNVPKAAACGRSPGPLNTLCVASRMTSALKREVGSLRKGSPKSRGPPISGAYTTLLSSENPSKTEEPGTNTSQRPHWDKMRLAVCTGSTEKEAASDDVKGRLSTTAIIF